MRVSRNHEFTLNGRLMRIVEMSEGILDSVPSLKAIARSETLTFALDVVDGRVLVVFYPENMKGIQITSPHGEILHHTVNSLGAIIQWILDYDGPLLSFLLVKENPKRVVPVSRFLDISNLQIIRNFINND